jgi:hypothetical protein
MLSLVLCVMAVPNLVRAQAPASSVAAHIGDFHMAVSNYYHVPQREVIVVRERRIRDEELPVVFFIAQRARVAPATIVDLRSRGLSWWDISVRYGIGPDVYYVPVAVAPGPPYGKAYGHYKKPRKQWNTIVLSDDDVVNLVHVRFLSEHYRVPPERVMEARAHHRDLVHVNQEVARHSSARRDEHSQGHQKNQGGTAKSNGSQDNSKGKSNGSNGRGNGKANGKH